MALDQGHTMPRMTSTPSQAIDRTAVPWKIAYDGPGAVSITTEDDQSVCIARSSDIARHIVTAHNLHVGIPTQSDLSPDEHYLVVDESGWMVQHSVMCRSLGINWMNHCDAVQVVRLKLDAPHYDPGTYLIDMAAARRGDLHVTAVDL